GIQKSLSLDGRNAQVSETLYEHMLLHNNGLTTEHVTSDHFDFGFDIGVHPKRIRHADQTTKSGESSIEEETAGARNILDCGTHLRSDVFC
ncbi:hypothetical protein, partial [Pararhizobium sp. DWP1-1-3]|uniref:hypothetical protein n=1 Tax=Pararhizobium sp. DWP1-1-3 TaxID=2804652 RepID=UPI003CE949B3